VLIKGKEYYTLEKDLKNVEAIREFIREGYKEGMAREVPQEQSVADFAKFIFWAIGEGFIRGHRVALKEAGLGDQHWSVKIMAVGAFYGTPFLIVWWIKQKFDKEHKD